MQSTTFDEWLDAIAARPDSSCGPLDQSARRAYHRVTMLETSSVSEFDPVPIYEYTCEKCHAEFEQLIRSVEDEHALQCPKCSAKRIARRMSVPAAPRGAATSSPLPRAGCGRCGDPNGPCAID